MNRTFGVPDLLGRSYKYIRLEWTSEFSMLRVRLCVKPIQCYSLAVMAELQQMLDDIATNQGLVKHFVMTSDVPQVFNFGGDLALFVLLVKAQDLDSLKLYARRCIDLIWWMENAANYGVHTTVLVQGDTLGGGLESVLPFHKIIFERSALAGYPEVLFNLFPGMGAWNFTVRRAGYAIASAMILSGKVYSAQELFEFGLVDLVVEDGTGEIALGQAVRAVHPKLQGVLAGHRSRQLAAPISYESLIGIVDLWAETALKLSDRDLRLMERLSKAQIRKVGGVSDEGAIEEIKRLELDSAWGEEDIEVAPEL